MRDKSRRRTWLRCLGNNRGFQQPERRRVSDLGVYRRNTSAAMIPAARYQNRRGSGRRNICRHQICHRCSRVNLQMLLEVQAHLEVQALLDVQAPRRPYWSHWKFFCFGTREETGADVIITDSDSPTPKGAAPPASCGCEAVARGTGLPASPWRPLHRASQLPSGTINKHQSLVNLSVAARDNNLVADGSVGGWGGGGGQKGTGS